MGHRRLRRPGLRTVLALLFALVAAVVTVLVGLLSHDAATSVVRLDRTSAFDEAVEQVQVIATEKAFPSSDRTWDGQGGEDTLQAIREVVRAHGSFGIQVLDAEGGRREEGTPVLPVGDGDRSSARSRRPGLKKQRQVEIGGEKYWVATVALGKGRGAVQVSQPFSHVEELLRELRQRTVLFMAAAVAVSGVAGWWLAGLVTRRLVRLTRIAESVTAAGRPDALVPDAGQDEVGRLGRAFNGMLARLARAREAQQRLAQDAGHELRTPLTSLRTNISLLHRFEELPPGAREGLIADLDSEARELTELVDELVELAAGQRDDEPKVEVELGSVAETAAARARRRTGREITVTADGTVVRGRPTELQRALSNLVENAAKFDRDGAEPIEIVVRDARVEVRDRGPGIAEKDLAHVFDRFYRAAGARNLPGSGLGLAIVQEVAAAHGGT
ncbi:sensor histidine kinase, partial [Streptomyces boncukensis]